MRPRLALCGNVFRADALDDVLAALAGPVNDWAGALRGSGYPDPIGFGLYLSAAAAAQALRSPEQLLLLRRAIAAAGVQVWTANAFPYGGFHGARVKERAFLPDWRAPERLTYTRDVAALLATLLPPGGSGSLSTCPLGYGTEAREAPAAWDHLRRMQEVLLSIERGRGVRLTLAIEPEPDGAFERCGELCAALSQRLYRDTPPEQRRVGLCWDLCHAAVVGEPPAEVLAAAEHYGIPVGKVQVSAALAVAGPWEGAVRARLAALAADPYFHQVRGRRGAAAAASPDLAAALAEPVADWVECRIHCHVPLHRDDFGDGLRATAWRAGLAAAAGAGLVDFEVETYTLPVLPREFQESAGIVGTLAAEMAACARELGRLRAE